MVKLTAPPQPPCILHRGLSPVANFRGSDPRPLERVFSLSPSFGPLYGDGFEVLMMLAKACSVYMVRVIDKIECS